MLRYLTAGESHGQELTAILDGLPSGLYLVPDMINDNLARRQGGYGRGGRMKIETDKVSILSGVRWGVTTGAPITLSIKNKDWENWKKKMSPDEACKDADTPVTKARPGHADLSGAIKYNHSDVRNILERSSARETAIRVAVGSLTKIFLKTFDIDIYGYVIEVGGIKAVKPEVSLKELLGIVEKSEFFTFDLKAEELMKKCVDNARDSGDSVGGVVEVLAKGVPVGLGSHVQWDRKLDARLAMALTSIQAIKGVEIGAGFSAASNLGSKVHDEIFYDADKIGSFYRETNNAGGIEGGISNGEDIVVRAAMKPIPTLYKPLNSVDIISKEPVTAVVERSDVCAVPAASVVAEAVVAIEIAAAFLDKFGGDSLEEIRRNYESYMKYVQRF